MPRGKSAADIPAEDKVGDMLQEAVTEAAKKWRPDRLSIREVAAIEKAKRNGEYWLARLLEREARGRFVHEELKAQMRGNLRFKHQGADVVDLKTGRQYEILSGTESKSLRNCTVILKVSARNLIIVGARFIDCTFEVKELWAVIEKFDFIVY